MRRRATPGDAYLAEIGGGPASGGPCRGFRRPRRDRGDRSSGSVHVLGTCRQTSGETSPQQSVAGECNQHQDWPGESSLQQVKKEKFTRVKFKSDRVIEGNRRVRECLESHPATRNARGPV